MTALAAAAARPPHLKAIVAVYATTDVYRDTITLGGCPAMLGRYAWAAHMMALGLCPPTAQDPEGRWRQVWDQRLRRLTQTVPHAITWQAHQDRDDEYWRNRVVDPSAIEIPAMLIGGWADAFATSMSSLYQAVRGPKRLVMGPWMHVLPHLSEVEPYDWVSEMADWWDAHLRPGPATTEDHAVCYVRNDRWRAAAQWPPAGGRELVLYPAGYGLSSEPPAGDTSRDYECDPAVGLAAGIFDPFGTGNGWPEEQSADDARSLTFTGDPLPEPLPPAGPDPGWVSDGQPVYRVHEDKTSGEVAVDFGVSSRLCPPSGADLRLDERFTARVLSGRPDGAALVAAVDVSVRMPAGERVQIAVRSASSRTATVIEGSVELDGACLLRRTWTNAIGEG
jgi:hypothetical protein